MTKYLLFIGIIGFMSFPIHEFWQWNKFKESTLVEAEIVAIGIDRKLQRREFELKYKDLIYEIRVVNSRSKKNRVGDNVTIYFSKELQKFRWSKDFNFRWIIASGFIMLVLFYFLKKSIKKDRIKTI